ncbi:beta strand repeat-containing protein [Brumimicrobium aurantiacum]|uniref:T9SS C-terminal target domain-containing protein n=1 Tax=Brumimicrobium aurantiacum TaxID=1737063 RepID=A0A3E1F0R0_9FLAO|nr:hypothetical protein [Brumimicrobium aurantiacum]RFC55412.1 hypothetical protein DXU93_00305 [Brumimicrobium aurantiacum]
MKRILIATTFFAITFGLNAQTGNENLGTGAGASLTTGDYNTAIGDSAMTNLTSGSYNAALGWKAGYNLTSSSEGVYIGYEAGFSDDNGFDNVMIGFRAGYYNTGGDNTFIGNGAGFENTSGNDNTFIGERAGARVVDGDDNTYIGAQAGSASGYVYPSSGSSQSPFNSYMQGSDNTAVGSSSGARMTTGYRNAFFGASAGYDNTTGYWNTFVGDSAGVDNGTGKKNTFIGQGAGSANEHASNNTFVGFKAGGDNNRTNVDNINNAQRNTYLGTQTGSINRTGSDNTGVGTFANFTSNNFSRSTFIGSGGQGWDNDGRFDGFGMVGASDVIVMGYRARNTGQYGIAIGNNIYQRGIYTVAMGEQLNTSNAGDYGVSIGALNYLSDSYSVGIGYNDSITGQRSIGLGAFSVVSSDSAIAIGANTKVSGSNSVAIGNGASTSQNNSLVLGGATASNRMSVGIGTSSPNTKASLTLADSDKGFMINKMTTAERTTFGGTLGANDQGMSVFDTDLNAIYSWDGTDWTSSNNTDEQTLTLTGTSLEISNGNSINLSGIDTDTQLSEAQVDAFVANNGYLTSFTEVDGSVTNEIQDISLSGTDLSLTSGSTIDLSSINTDTQLSEAQVDAFVANNGYLTSFTEVDGSVTNEIQDISLTGTNLSLTDGSTIDLSSINTDTQLTEAQVDGFVANNGYLTSFTEVDGSVTNEIQDISLTGTDLSLTSGSTIDLSSINTDTQLSEAQVDNFVANNGYLTSFTEVDGSVTNEIQDISLTGTDLSLTSGSTIDLSSINTDTQLSEAQVDNFVANNGYLTSFTEVDGSVTNEIQDISLTGTDLSLTSGSTIDLSSINTDTQLSEAQVDGFVANNGYLTSFTEVDGSVTNEIQDISLTGTDLSLTSGSTIDLSSINTDTQLSEAQVDGFVANNGYLTSFTEVDGSVTNEIQDISLSGTDLSLTSGSTIDLSSINTDTQLSEAQVDNFVANNGYLTSFTEVDGSVTNEIQDISLSGTDLSLTSGSTIDLSSINTDTQLTEAQVDNFVANNGYLTSFTEVDGSVTNEIQDISLTGTDLSLTSGSTIDLSSINTDTQLSEAQVDNFVANNGYLTSFTEVDGSVTNEIQDISLSGTDLSLTSGSTIDLSSINTDTQLSEAQVDGFVANNGYLTSFTEVDGSVTNEIQDISLTGTDLSLTSGSTIDLSSINTDTQLSEAQVDAFVGNNGYLTSFTEVDGSVTNEIQDISLTGTDLSLTSGSTIDLSSINTDTQLSEAQVDGFVANNGYLTSFTEVDGSVTNEIQDISLTGTDLSLTSGSTIDLSGIDTDTDEQDLTSATLSGTNLQIEIENGASVTVDLSPLLQDLQNQINELKSRVEVIEDCACDGTLGLVGSGIDHEKPILYQNIPNPFNNTSTIKYYIPSWATSANLVVSDGMGKIVSNISIQEVGDYGNSHINAEGLSTGTYYYSLYVNQNIADTKKMVVQ